MLQLRFVAVVVFFALTPYRLFSRDVTGAMLVFLNNRTAAMLVSPTNVGGIEPLLSCKRFVLFRWKNKITDHVSENTVIQQQRQPQRNVITATTLFLV